MSVNSNFFRKHSDVFLFIDEYQYVVILLLQGFYLLRRQRRVFFHGLFISGIIIVRSREGGWFAMVKGVRFVSGPEGFLRRKEPGTKEKSHCGT